MEETPQNSCILFYTGLGLLDTFCLLFHKMLLFCVKRNCSRITWQSVWKASRLDLKTWFGILFTLQVRLLSIWYLEEEDDNMRWWGWRWLSFCFPRCRCGIPSSHSRFFQLNNPQPPSGEMWKCAMHVCLVYLWSNNLQLRLRLHLIPEANLYLLHRRKRKTTYPILLSLLLCYFTLFIFILSGRITATAWAGKTKRWSSSSSLSLLSAIIPTFFSNFQPFLRLQTGETGKG